MILLIKQNAGFHDGHDMRVDHVHHNNLHSIHLINVVSRSLIQ